MLDSRVIEILFINSSSRSFMSSQLYSDTFYCYCWNTSGIMMLRISSLKHMFIPSYLGNFNSKLSGIVFSYVWWHYLDLMASEGQETFQFTSFVHRFVLKYILLLENYWVAEVWVYKYYIWIYIENVSELKCVYVLVCVCVYMCVGWRLTKENVFPLLDTLMTKNSPDHKLADLATLCFYYEIK